MKKTLAVFASLFIAGSACALVPDPAADTQATSTSSAPAPSREQQRHDARLEKHIREMHENLEITPAEEPQWAAVAKAMHDSASDIDSLIEKRESSRGNATALDDLNAYGAIAEAHAQAVKNLSAAFAPLYGAMPDDQKKVADAVFAHHAHKGGHRHTAVQ